MTAVKKVLANNRNPQLPSEVGHAYIDKYSLADLMTNAALAAQINSLSALGLTSELLQEIKKWSKDRSVTLTFSAEETCGFVEKKTRDIHPDVTTKTEVNASFFGKATFSSKTITTVTDYLWKHNVVWQLYVYQGNNPKDRVVLQVQKLEHIITTNSDDTPLPATRITSPVEVNITWLMQQLNGEGTLAFKIDRSTKDCKTPRRNRDIDQALDFCLDFYNMSGRVASWLHSLFNLQTGHDLDMSAINTSGLFVPVLPLFENSVDEKDEVKNTSLVAIGPVEQGEKSPLLPLGDVHKFLTEQQRCLAAKFAALAKIYPATPTPISTIGATFVVVCKHIQDCCNAYKQSVDYVEHLLRSQLIAAIGKEVSPSDFAECMEFHNRKMFKHQYQPKGFCYAIRRPEHSPEGTLSIENNDSSQPIYTSVRQSESNFGMKFPINAATSCTFFGKRYLHACIMHKFSGQSPPSLSLSARARQFSSFILMVGAISSKDSFDPKHAIIIQNKDDLKIPLVLETFPTPKEFKDAIESLSPEQQRFCKAFRSMQLASTLFGVCVVQIKPQLEKLLNLPDDSLTKEIRLTQDLMDLFIKYQIPSDLISYAVITTQLTKLARLLAKLLTQLTRPIF